MYRHNTADTYCQDSEWIKHIKQKNYPTEEGSTENSSLCSL